MPEISCYRLIFVDLKPQSVRFYSLIERLLLLWALGGRENIGACPAPLRLSWKRRPHTPTWGSPPWATRRKHNGTQCLVVPDSTMVNKYMVGYGRGRQNDSCLVEGERQV